MIDSKFIQESLAKIWDQVIAFLPTFLMAVVLLIVGWVFARLLAALTRRVLRRLGIDDIVQRVGLAEGFAQVGITRPATEWMGLVIFWLVFLSFVLLALEHIGLMAVVLPLQQLIAYLPRLLAAALILVVGAFLAQFLDRVAQATAASMGIEFHQTLGRLVRVLLLVVTVMLSVDQLGIDLTLLTDTFTNLITVAAAGFALAFAFGARGVASNALAGYYAREQFTLGERVVIDGQEGTLEAIGTLNAEIFVGQDRLLVPNTHLIESRVKIRRIPDDMGDQE